MMAGDSWWQDGTEFFFKFGDAALEGTSMFNNEVNGAFQVPFRISHEQATGGYQQDLNHNFDSTIVDDGLTWVQEVTIGWAQFNDGNGDAIVPVDGYSFLMDVNVKDSDAEEGDEKSSNNYWSSSVHVWNADFSEAGTVTLSDTELDPDWNVGIREASKVSYEVYPNPVENVLRIKGDASAVKVYSVVGKEVLSRNLSNAKSVNVSELSHGVYFINLYKDGQFVTTKKFVKTK